MRKNKGFTILEILVVIAILAILAVIVVPNFIDAVDRSRASTDLAEINSIDKAVSMYYMEHGTYPVMQSDQPVYGNPENIDFNKIYPEYIDKLPHFSYWVIDYKGSIYHLKYSIGTISNNIITLNSNYRYKIYDLSGNEVLNYTDTIVNLTQYSKITPIAEDGKVLPDITSAFVGLKEHPQSPGYNPNRAPTAVITMSPESGIVTGETITWGYDKSADPDEDNIVDAQWQGKQDIYSIVGEYTVQLRVQDSNGAWSDWVSKTFKVGQAINRTCLKFPGVVSIPHQAYYQPNNFTIELWIKLPSTNGNIQGIITKSASTGYDREFNMEVAPNGVVHYYIVGPGSMAGTSSTVNVADGKWHYIVAQKQYTDKGDIVTLYVDGAKYQVQSSIHANKITTPLLLGTVAVGDGRQFTGYIDEVRFWNTIRTEDEMQADKNIELEGTEQGLVGYWNFNESSGSIAHDKTSNQNNGTISGPSWMDQYYIVPSANVGRVYASPEAGWTRFDNTNAGITYENMILWTTSDTTNFVNGNVMYDSVSSIPDGSIAKAQFKFTGTQLRLLCQCYAASNCARNANLNIYIDDKYIGRATAPQRLIDGHVCYYESPLLADGTHTLRIEHTKGPIENFILDGIDVRGGSIVN